MFKIQDKGLGWHVVGPCPWTGEERVLFRGWHPGNPETLKDAGIAMVGLQDCLSFVRDAENEETGTPGP